MRWHFQGAGLWLATALWRAMLCGMRNCMVIWVLLLAHGWGLSACGLVRMPLRVLGSVAQGTYHAGKKAVTASSQAMEKRKDKQAAEEKARNQGQAQGEKGNPAKPEKSPAPAPAPVAVPPPPPLGADPKDLPPLPDNLPPLPEVLPSDG